MDEAAMGMLEVEARAIYEGCAPDMEGWSLIDSADFVAGRLYDEYHDQFPGTSFFAIAKEALKGYF